MRKSIIAIAFTSENMKNFSTYKNFFTYKWVKVYHLAAPYSYSQAKFVAFF
jgi:hypothetical protein